MIEVIQADPSIHSDAIRELFWEYLQWASEQFGEEIQGAFNIADMLEHDMLRLDKFMTPGGRLLLCRCDDQWASIACLRRREQTIGEVKRMYVRPAFRRRGIVRMLLNQLIEQAAEMGCLHLRLDSARFMKEAHELYRTHGFREIEPYKGSEIPKELQSLWLFMQEDLI
jgi:GNAT superfamily N-acetyltransferase